MWISTAIKIAELIYDEAHKDGMGLPERLARYPGCRALLSVKSLNSANGSHVIYWDGASILDPSTLRRYNIVEEIDDARGITFFKAPVLQRAPERAGR